MRGKFWRLLNAYESLTREQEIALRAPDVSIFNEAQAKKSAIFSDLLASAESERMTDEPEAQARVKTLLATEKNHAGILRRLQTGAHAERQQLLLAGQRLKALRGIYATFGGPPRHAFTAHV